MAAMVDSINQNEKCHIITLEDPIEYAFEDKQSVLEQREIGLDTLSFERALVHVDDEVTEREQTDELDVRSRTGDHLGGEERSGSLEHRRLRISHDVAMVH